MTAQKGSQFILKKGNEELVDETFTAIAGMRTTAFSLSNRGVENTNQASGAWREMMDMAGTKSLSISGSGIFLDSASEEIIRQRAFSGSIKNYQITFGNGDNLKGAFLISSYQRSGNYDDEEQYSISLESAGEIEYSAS